MSGCVGVCVGACRRVGVSVCVGVCRVLWSVTAARNSAWRSASARTLEAEKHEAACLASAFECNPRIPKAIQTAVITRAEVI